MLMTQVFRVGILKLILYAHLNTILRVSVTFTAKSLTQSSIDSLTELERNVIIFNLQNKRQLWNDTLHLKKMTSERKKQWSKKNKRGNTKQLTATTKK